MAEKTEVAPNEKLIATIWQSYGLAIAYEAMGGDKPKSTLPGFSLAMALVEKEMAETRAAISGEVYRCAARAGHDIGKASSIFTSIKNGKPLIEIEFVVEQAETV